MPEEDAHERHLTVWTHAHSCISNSMSLLVKQLGCYVVSHSPWKHHPVKDFLVSLSTCLKQNNEINEL